MRREFVYLCVTRFLMSLSWTMISILLVIYASGFHASALFGLMWSVIGVSRLLSEAPGGILVDRMGCRPVIGGGLASIAAAYLGFASAKSSTMVLFCSALAGMGFAVAAIGLLVQAAYYAPEEERVGYMGVLNGSMMAANIVGPATGGFIAEAWGLRIAFVASAITVSSALPLALMTGDAGSERESVREAGGVLQDYLSFVRNGLYLTLFLFSFLHSLANWGFRSLVLPTYGRSVLSLTISQIGLISSVASASLFIEQFFLSHQLARLLGRRALVTLGLSTCGVAVYLFSILSRLYPLAASSALLGLGLGMVTPSLEAVWIDITKPEKRGRIYGLRIAFFDLGQIFWSRVITNMTEVAPLLPIYTTASISLFNAAILHLALRRIE